MSRDAEERDGRSRALLPALEGLVTQVGWSYPPGAVVTHVPLGYARVLAQRDAGAERWDPVHGSEQRDEHR